MLNAKTKGLIALNLALLAAVVLSWYALGREAASAAPLPNTFAVADTAALQQLQIGTLALEKEADGHWAIPGAFDVLPSRMATFLAIMTRIETKRAISRDTQDDVYESMATEGVEVVLRGNDAEQRFSVFADGEETYFTHADGQIYSVHIPGYFIRVGDIFEETDEAWRDTRTLRTSWRTLQRLSVSYAGDTANSFTIAFDADFYTVAGLKTLDSAALYRYIGQFEDLRFKEQVPADAPLADSLAANKPFAVIALEDLKRSRNRLMEVYPARSGIYGRFPADGRIVSFEPAVIENVLVSRRLFDRSAKQ